MNTENDGKSHGVGGGSADYEECQACCISLI